MYLVHVSFYSKSFASSPIKIFSFFFFGTILVPLCSVANATQRCIKPRNDRVLVLTDGAMDSKGPCAKFCKRLTQITIFFVVFILLFAVMVWDLRKAHMLSEIIHDDHTSHWAQLSMSDLKLWLSPLDVCMLNASSPSVDLQSYKTKHCSKLTSAVGSTALHLSCSIGSSISGKLCQPPLSSRTFFTAHLRDKMLGNSSSNTLKSSLRKFAALQKPIIFVGDGLSKQNQEALLCEILRTDRVTLTGSTSAIDGNYTIHWRQSNNLKLDVHYMKLTNMYDNGEDEGIIATNSAEDKNKKEHIRRILHSEKKSLRKANETEPQPATNAATDAATNTTSTLQVIDLTATATKNTPNPETAALSSILPINPNLTNHEMSNTSFAKRNQHKIPLSLTLDSIKNRVQDLVEIHPGVVLIVNVGVWYNSRELFRKELPDLLSWMNQLSKERNSSVYFRETAAQHWNHTTSGYYDLNYEDRQYNNGSCVPVADSTPGRCVPTSYNSP